ncbi:MAG: HAMP domain-containing histidine kinase [Chloroflexi bacterium]|nr:HAMP domain-containing histidine kinase [Chloroflexota bacterium]
MSTETTEPMFVSSHTLRVPKSIARAASLGYPLTSAFALVSLIIAIIASSQIISLTTDGATDQLIHTIESEVSEDLSRNIHLLHEPGTLLTLEGLLSGGNINSWFEHARDHDGASVTVIFDPSGKAVWSNDPTFVRFEGDDERHLAIALSGQVTSELEKNVPLLDAQGRVYVSDAVETYLPLVPNAGDDPIGVLEVYVDVKDDLDSAISAAQSNIFRSVVLVMAILTALLICAVFVAEVLLRRADRKRQREEGLRAEADAQLASAVQSTRESEIAERERQRFLGVVSHELKTPLTSVLAFNSLIARNRDGNLTERQTKHLDLIKKNAQRLDGLIDDLLDVSRLETGNFTLRIVEFPIRELVNELSQSLSDTFELNSQNLVIELPDSDSLLVADRDRIFQVASNLLTNASKYSPANSTITLMVSTVDDRFQMIVSDQGPGLTESEQLRVFDPFYRTQSVLTRAIAGSGIGLSIAKAIVELHEGHISVESTVGAGSRFIVDLPGVISEPSGTHPQWDETHSLDSYSGSRLDELESQT